MLSVLFSLLLLLTGGIVASVFWGKRFEEVLPTTVSGIVLFLFFFGVAGFLEAGLYTLFAISAAAYLLCSIYVIKHRTFARTVRLLVTPGAVYYFCSVILIAFLLRGKLFIEWDEFSHWGDVVKATTMTNALSTNPQSHSFFRSYPPAMVLFQYVLQKINPHFSRDGFSEWLTYPAYYMFIAAFLVPVFQRIKKIRSVEFLYVSCIVFLAPLCFFSNIYYCLYIDPALSVVIGSGLFLVFTYSGKEKLFVSNLAGCCSMLVLLKDAGLLFAALLAIEGNYVYHANRMHSELSKKGTLTAVSKAMQALPYMLILISVVLPKLLWQISINVNHIQPQFTNSFDINELLNVLLGRDTTYRLDVWFNYLRSWIGCGITIGYTGITVTFFILSVLFIATVVLLFRRYVGQGLIPRSNQKAAGVTCILMVIIYILGLGFTYITKFDEREATDLASFQRYMNILYCGEWVFLVQSFVTIAASHKSAKKYLAIVMILVLIISPLIPVYDLTMGRVVKASQEFRTAFADIAHKLDELPQNNKRIYILSQGSDGYDYWALRYLGRPHISNKNYTWSIGQNTENDPFTKEIVPRQWIRELFRDYEYLVLYRADEYFINNFFWHFSVPKDEIEDHNLYKIDKQQMLLVPVD